MHKLSSPWTLNWFGTPFAMDFELVLVEAKSQATASTIRCQTPSADESINVHYFLCDDEGDRLEGNSRTLQFAFFALDTTTW
mmetsp:Transcript_30211/g.89927  ORF Transcript_30211/g.89927 Transcript_30211/m.89927 type:complete len:82 (+) Transcript_30211:576-821(+)